MEEFKWLSKVKEYPVDETIIFLKGIIKKIIDGNIILDEKKDDIDMQILSVTLILLVNKIEKKVEEAKKEKKVDKLKIEDVVLNNEELGYDCELDDFLYKREKRDETVNINANVNLNDLKKPYHLSWDDFGYQNTYNMYIGDIKLGSIKTVPEKVETIDDIKFSIGWKPEYYDTLDVLFNDDVVKAEYFIKVKDINSFAQNEYEALKNDNLNLFDTAIYRFDTTRNEYKKKFVDTSQNLLRKELYLEDDLLKTRLEIEYDEKNSFLENRMKVFIGKNGTGKSYILKELFKKTQKISNFDYQLYFSFGTYDNVYKKRSHAFSSINLTEINSFDEFRLIFSEKVLLANKYRQIIEFMENTLEHTQIAKDFIIEFEALFTEDETIYSVYKKFLKLSTGQKLSVIFIIEINLKIRDNSIIFIDELENSLHPNLLNSLLGTIDNILRKYKSYAVLSTHSHLIVQSIPSADIYIFKTDDNLKTEISSPNTELFANEFDQILLKIYDIEFDDLYFNQKIKKAQTNKLYINSEKLLNKNLFIDYLLGEEYE